MMKRARRDVFAGRWVSFPRCWFSAMIRESASSRPRAAPHVTLVVHACDYLLIDATEERPQVAFASSGGRLVTVFWRRKTASRLC